MRVLLYVFLCLYFTNFLLLHFYLCSVLAPSCSDCTCNTITYVFSMYSVLNIVLWFSEDLINVLKPILYLQGGVEEWLWVRGWGESKI